MPDGIASLRPNCLPCAVSICFPGFAFGRLGNFLADPCASGGDQLIHALMAGFFILRVRTIGTFHYQALKAARMGADAIDAFAAVWAPDTSNYRMLHGCAARRGDV